MRAQLAALTFSLFAAAIVSAQGVPPGVAAPTASGTNSPDFSAINCAGFISDKVADDTQLVSGEQSNPKITWTSGDYVFINRGRNKGVQVGDRFSVIRADKDPMDVPWFKWQRKLLKAMGQLYTDIGELRIVQVQDKTATAQVGFSCGWLQRGDIVRPYVERPSPPFKEAGAFDHFAPVSGKRVGMVVAASDYGQLSGKNSAVYVNLGSNQSVRVGDYFRIFRYQGTRAETAYQTKDYQYKIYGFGSAHEKYSWNDLPREIVGEGIVLSSNANASTVLITYSSLEVYAGDYVELE
jgi:hypothetical protein